MFIVLEKKVKVILFFGNRKENWEIRNAILIKKKSSANTWKGEKLIYARDVENDKFRMMWNLSSWGQT